MKVVTPAQMAAIDRKAIDDKKLPSLLLMEHAGLKACDVLRREVPGFLGEKILVVAGTGNNAGDGFVIARNLARAGAVVAVELVRGEKDVRGDAAVNLASLAAYDIEVFHALPGHPLRTLLADTTIVIDAMLGTGAHGELAADYRDAVENINQTRRKVMALDVPTGLDATTGQVQGPAVRASFTVTMGLPKTGFFHYPAPDYLGTLYVAEIGFPPALLSEPELKTGLSMGFELSGFHPARRADSHKGDYGRILVIGGSTGMVGAPVLAARAALRGGGGLVKLVVPASQQVPAAALAPEVMVAAAPGTGDGTFGPESTASVLPYVKWADVVLLGPGLSRGPAVTEFVRQLVDAADRPMVLDADALHALPARKRLPQGDFLATPHAGELSHLLDLPIDQIRTHRCEVVSEAAQSMGLTLMLKGPYSLVTSTDGRLGINPTGNAGLATGGSGDVLAGLLAALRAYPGLASFDAMRTACYLHGLAGDLAAERLGGVSMVATDLLDDLSRAFDILAHATGPIAYDKVRIV
ncbi:MAG: NAD(P)H-hydrate dehydratase [Candidatus Riflebacteria bacterium]|nr:NAD(P)H-hydrate dehydratase [Candidatus Riflebacteria bacterium]